MIAGEASMAVMWSGDALYAMAANENLAYAVPEEGSNVWIDAMCIPKGSKNVEAAQKFIDFMCRPDVAEMNQDYIYYCSPIQQVVDNYDDEEKAEVALNPSDEVIERCEFFHDISVFIEMYDNLWMEIRA
jgi:spermidine/putrescine transport system substrate-binding protein